MLIIFRRSDSIIVDTLLNEHNEESFSATEALDGGDPASRLSLQDLTSLLVKTGFNFQFEDTNQVSQMLSVLWIWKVFRISSQEAWETSSARKHLEPRDP